MPLSRAVRDQVKTFIDVIGQRGGQAVASLLILLVVSLPPYSRQSLEMVAASAHPIVFSHANPKALVDNPRNVDDEQIRAVAERGGVIGTVNWGPLLFRDGMTARPTVENFLDHIDSPERGPREILGMQTNFRNLLGTIAPGGPSS